MAQIITAELEAFDPAIAGIRVLRYATQGYVTGPSRCNFLRYSEQFEQAGWSANAVTILESGLLAVDGSNGAQRLAFAPGGSLAQRCVLDLQAGDRLSWSVHCVGASPGLLQLGSSTPAGSDVSQVHSLGNGWYRHVLTRTFIAHTSAATVDAQIIGTGVLTLWGAQLERSYSATAYISTTSQARTEPATGQENTVFEGRVQQPANIQRSCFSDGRTAGRSQIGYGSLVLVNNDGGLDALLNYSFSGRPVTIRMGEVRPKDGGTPIWVNVIKGTMEQAEFTWNRVSIRVRDRQLELAKPLQQSKYLGDNILPNGLEGASNDLAGRPKPICLGQVFNAAVPLVNSARLIYQVHDGSSFQSIDAVYDRGAPLQAGSPYNSRSDMEANAPAAGQYRVWNGPQACYFRLGGQASGTITVDATQGATAASRTVAQLFRGLLVKAGIDAADINEGDISALDARAPAPVGLYVDPRRDMSFLDALDMLCSSVGAWFGSDARGQFRIGRIELPGTPSVGLITATDIVSIERRASADAGVGIPAWKIKLGYQRVCEVQTDLDSTVGAPHKGFVAAEYRRVEACDPSVQLANAASPEIEFTTLLVNPNDASAEAARRLQIYRQRRDMLEVSVRVDPALASVLDLGKVITLQVDRYGLNAGKQFLIIGLRTDMRNRMFDLTLWG